MRHRTCLIIALTLFATGMPSPGYTQAPQPLIVPGEVLTYRVHSGRFGDIGMAVMKVDADTLDGQPVHLLSFDFNARITLFKVSDQTRSWIDPVTFSTLRFTKRERSPVSKRDEDAAILADSGIWLDPAGAKRLGSEQPLDELAFIYLVRALATTEAQVIELHRHFDEARNPVVIQFLGEEPVSSPDGVQQTVVCQIEVKDSRQKNGVGRIRFHLSKDGAHVPVRIETSMPVAGTITMSLQSVTIAEQVSARQGDLRTKSAPRDDEESADSRQSRPPGVANVTGQGKN